MSPERDSSSPVTQPGLAGSPRANQWAMSRGTRGRRVLPPRWDGASVVVSWVQSQGKLYRQRELTGDSELALPLLQASMCAPSVAMSSSPVAPSMHTPPHGQRSLKPSMQTV